MTPKPVVFVGSSTEGLPIANALQVLLEHDADVSVWTQGSFELSKGFMESLEAELARADFAILALTPDDVETSRGSESAVPRDNVLFELGLFMGRLGRERCFFVHDGSKKIKLPSDLLGIAPAKYRPHANGSLPQSLGPVATRIRGQIESLGPRPKLDVAALKAFQSRREFSLLISGHWWQRIKPDDPTALSYMSISLDPATGSVRMTGHAYDRRARHAATWESEATAINGHAGKLFYYWTGWHPNEPNDSYEGFGELRFSRSGNAIVDATGLFSNTNLSDLSETIRKAITMRRATTEEVAVMEAKETSAIRELIRKVTDDFL